VVRLKMFFTRSLFVWPRVLSPGDIHSIVHFINLSRFNVIHMFCNTLGYFTKHKGSCAYCMYI
jgi:hypothetical protein